MTPDPSSVGMIYRYGVEIFGEPGRDRTDDPLIKSQMLYR